ncbi:MAG: efflux transporter periplasmic adaptor subunit [Gammaproteobacteria bacterium 28-57-27]|nr:MAG: efflux transporter periplasmic adaptor subunit [Gammaproteobacteria bacterium 28-57-27]
MNTSPIPDIQDKLKLHAKRKRPWFWFAVLIMLIGASAWWVLRPQQKDNAPRYTTEAASLGNLVVKVSATGNLEPINQVDVGSELSGILETVLVDDNDHVTQGQALARLDARRFQDQVNKSKAALAASVAQVDVAQATVTETRSQLKRLNELSKRSNGQMVSASEVNTAEANLARAQANVELARANVHQAEATLNSDQTNLTKAEIRSPINGVVLARQVEPGQTVAASLQAPVLFSLAEDLTRMQLLVSVDEADVGQVKMGQSAVFTVDAWRNRRYPATVTRVNFGSEVKEGVVTYPTVLEVNNDDLSLRPGMTATAEITTLNREQVLLVPNAALRFKPNATPIKPTDSGSSVLSSLVPKMPRSSSQRAGKKEANGNGMQTVYVLRNGSAVPLDIKVGPTDGTLTEVLAGELTEGAAVIVEQVTAKP